MSQKGSTWRNIFVWTYDRGTLPYDILCGLILVFIFFVPRSCFAPKKPIDSSVQGKVEQATSAKQVSSTPSPASSVKGE
jgi:hypothetical protein